MSGNVIDIGYAIELRKHSGCDHGIRFDEELARGLSSSDVRKRWPRHEGVCNKCGANCIAYASFSHYVSGDW